MSDDDSQSGDPRKDLRKILKEHQDQQLTFLTAMEGIRWRFITAFGIGAGFALFFAATKDGDSNTIESTANIAGALLIIISLAGLLTQVRIYGLVHSAWCRIRQLQRREADLTQSVFETNERYDHLFQFPHVTFEHSRASHIFTVHTATCFVFCAFVGIGISVLARLSSTWLSLAVAGGTALVLAAICWQFSVWYTDQLNRDVVGDDNDTK